MEWMDRMNQMVDYIEDHLDGEIVLDEIGRITAMPVSVLQRMLPVIAGTTLADYIRRRKLTLAASDLHMHGMKVIDAAMKYGYESPESFAAAFKKMHGVAPSAAKRVSAPLTSWPRLSFTLQVKGVASMEYRVETREAFRVVGKAIAVSQEEKGKCAQLWDSCMADGTCAQLAALGGPSLGICFDGDETGRFKYMAGAASDTVPAGLDVLEIPAATYAVFTSIGAMPQAIWKIWERVYGEFFPSGAYDYGGTPDFELYPPGDMSRDDYMCEVWVPVKAKG